MRIGRPRIRGGLAVAAAAFAIAGCGGPTLEEKATSALQQQENQRSGSKKGQAAEPAVPVAQQGKPSAPRPTSRPSDSKAPTLRIGDAEVHVDRREVQRDKAGPKSK